MMYIQCMKCKLFASGDTKRLRNIDPLTYLCKECRGWNKIDAVITSEQLEIIEGWLLSDACLFKMGNFGLGLKFEEPLKTVCQLIPSLYWGSIRKKENSYIKTKNKIFGPYTSYSIQSQTCNFLKQLEQQWYIPHPNPRKNCKRLKIIPPNFQLTPTKVYYWFIGDGSTGKDSKSKTICLATNGFQDKDIQTLSNLLIQLNITNTIRNKMIWIESKDMIKKFFDYIGPCKDSVYQYKWNILDYVNTPDGRDAWWDTATEEQKQDRVNKAAEGSRTYWSTPEGINKKKLQRKYTIDDTELIKLYNSGISTGKIAKQIGCVQGTIRARLINLGIKLRSANEAAKLAWENRS